MFITHITNINRPTFYSYQKKKKSFKEITSEVSLTNTKGPL